MPTNPYEAPKERSEAPDPMRDPTQLEELTRAIGRWLIYRVKAAIVFVLLLAALVVVGFLLNW
jgi:hypothetical protein